MRLRIDPAWRRASRGLLRYPAAVAALTLASAAAVAVLVSQPLYVGSVTTAMLTQELASRPPLHGGLLVATRGPLSRPAVEPVIDTLAAELRSIGGRERAIVTLAGSAELQVARDGVSRPGRLFARTGAPTQLPVVRRLGASGVWLSEHDARALRLGPDVTVALRLGGATAQVPVAGTYGELLSTRTAPYWQQVTADVLPRSGFTTREPPLVIADPDTLLDVTTQLGDGGRLWWQLPLGTEGITLSAARRHGRMYDAAERHAFAPRTPLGAAFAAYEEPPEFVSGLRDALTDVTGDVRVLQAPVQAIAVSAGLVTLGLVAAAMTLVLAQRQREVRLHAVRGTGLLAYAAHNVVAAAPVVVVGAIAGTFAMTLLVRQLGPTTRIGPSHVQDAVLRAGLGVAGCVAVVGAVSAAALWRHASATDGRLDRTRWAWWEPVVLTLAAVGWLQTRDVAPGGTGADVVTLALPVLLLVGLLGIAGRLLSLGLPLLRRRSARRLTAVLLALRRLAAPRSAAPLLLVSTGIAAGLLVYAVTAYTSNTEALAAKTAVSLGANVVARLTPDADVGSHDLPDDMALVLRGTATVTPGSVPVWVYGVDPATFERVADWHPWFSDVPLAQLLHDLDSDGEPLPAIAAGRSADGRLVPTRGHAPSAWYPTDIQVVRRTRALPRMPNGRRPALLVDQSRLLRLIGTRTDPVTGEAPDVRQAVAHELWSDRSLAATTAWLDANDVRTSSIDSQADVMTDGRVLVQSWSLNYLRILGFLAAVMMFATGVLVLQQRQQERYLSYGFARQMGLRPGTHRAALFAEIAMVFLTATLFGAIVGLAGAEVIVTRLDPLPRIVPQPQLVVPLGWIAIVAVGALGLSLITAGWLHARSQRVDLTEVLRAHG